MKTETIFQTDSGENQIVTNADQISYRSMIYTVRGVQVMLDRDLAAAYQVTTTVFNQAVKRNANRFPDGFRFQLTKEEHAVLMSQVVTSKREAGEETRGGYHKLPYTFTEQGIAMLSGVLKSDVAVAVSIRLINAFVNMRKAISRNRSAESATTTTAALVAAPPNWALATLATLPHWQHFSREILPLTGSIK